MTLVVSMAIAPALSQDAFAVVPNLITNGGFEADTVTDNGGTWELFPTISGWTVTAACVPVGELQTTSLGLATAQDGINYMELDGNCSNTISQTIPTVNGHNYELNFYTQARPATSDATNAIDVFIGGSSVYTNTVDSISFVLHTVQFTAVAGTTTEIKFVDVGTSDGLGTFLDAISVVETDSAPKKPKQPNLTLEYNPTNVSGIIRANNDCTTFNEPTSYDVWKRVSLATSAPWSPWLGPLVYDQTVTAEASCANTVFNDPAVNVGEHIRYRIIATNAEGNSPISGLRDITIEPGTPPTLTINGASQAIGYNVNFVNPSATCTDIEDGGDISGNIIVTGSVGGIPGNYLIEYECTDSTGNTVMDSITITRNESGGGSGDDAHKTAPTFGIDWNTKSQNS